MQKIDFRNIEKVPDRCGGRAVVAVLRDLVAAAVVLGALATSGAYADADARAIVDRAIEAAGGRDAIAKYHQPFYCEREGRYFGTNGDGEIKQRITKWLPNRIRAEYDSATLDGKTTSQVRVFDGKAGRDKRPNGNSGQLETVALPADLTDQWRDRLHADWLATLLPLVDRDVDVTLADETVVEGRPSVSLRCITKDRAEVRLYFDKETFRLTKLAYQRRSDGKLFEDHFEDYAELDGIFYPRKCIVYFDGAKKMELRTTTFKFVDTPPDGTFATP